MTAPAAAQSSRAPAAPSFEKEALTFDARGARVAWRDRSDNEDGFRIVVTFRPSGERFVYRAAANAIEFGLPPDIPFAVRTPEECRARREVAVSVEAFNAAGESSSGETAVQRECSDPPSTGPSARLPRTGTGVGLGALPIVGGLLLMAGAGLRGQLRSRSGRCG